MTGQQNQTESFQIGDIVRLKIGSHLMSVGAVEKDDVTCDWALKGDIRSRKFNQTQLEIATLPVTLDELFGKD